MLRRGTAPVFLAAVVVSLALRHTASATGEADALTWCAQDTGVPICAPQYMALAPQCLGSGFRSCVIGKARDAARSDNCALALKLAKLCQCHNAAVRDSLDQIAVCDWLKAN
jgi:hypothetical protein